MRVHRLHDVRVHPEALEWRCGLAKHWQRVSPILVVVGVRKRHEKACFTSMEMSRVCVGLSENPKTSETSLAESPFSKTTVATLAGATCEWVGVAVKQGRAGAVQVEQSAVLAIGSVEVLVKLLLAEAQE